MHKDDLFGDAPPPSPRRKPDDRATSHASSYSAADIEVLEGLEPVRRRPGMYIGGTDSNALHHLFAEVIDNSMDEAIAGHASRIEVHLSADGYITVGAATDALFRRLCEVLGHPEWTAEPDFADNTHRVHNRGALAERIESMTVLQPCREWIARLDAAGIPCGPINDYPAAFADPHIRARGMIVNIDHPTLGAVVVKNGRYGAYVSAGGINATLPGEKTPDTITIAEAIALLDERAAKGGGSKRGARKAAKPKAEKTATAKPEADSPASPAKKAVAKKSAAKPKSESTSKARAPVTAKKTSAKKAAKPAGKKRAGKASG